MKPCTYFLAAVCTAASLSSQSVHATSVIAVDNKAGAGGGTFVTANLLGAPDSQVCSLGNSGYVTLGFAVTIVDGPGADLVVAENPFFSGPVGFAFAETCFVEVSSNGVDFARFPSAYYGPQTQPGPFGVVSVGAYAGLGGVCPVYPLANALDLVRAGGDAFDLADLKGDPLVLQGKVKLNQITQVRLVDLVSGVDRDSRNVLIFDPSTGSADVDGVTVLNHAGNQTAGTPLAALRIPADGNFELVIGDPDGIQDLDPASLGISVWGTPLANPFDLLAALPLANVTPTAITWKLGSALPPGFLLRLSVSVSDHSGHRSGATRVRPG